MLHTPYASLRPAVGNCCRRIWRLGRSGGKADSSRRGGLEVLEVCQAEASNVQVNCCLRYRSDERKDVVEGNQRKMEKSGGLSGRREEPPAGCCSRGVNTNGRCGRQHTGAARTRAHHRGQVCRIKYGGPARGPDRHRRAPRRTPCERKRATKADCALESTRRKLDTQDLNEPLNTNLRGGGISVPAPRSRHDKVSTYVRSLLLCK